MEQFAFVAADDDDVARTTSTAATVALGGCREGRVRRFGRSIRRPCFATDGTRLVLPAFGALTGGLNVLDKAFSPLFERKKFSAFLLGENRLYPFTASRLIGD